MFTRILVTGGAGFIGSNFVRYMLEQHPAIRLINLDLLTYAGNRRNLADVEADPRHRFVHGDICDGDLVRCLLAEEAIDLVINFAAESHVDRSIADPGAFVRTNVLGTQTLLDAVLQQNRTRTAPPIRFIQVSTDEVYGSLGPGGLFTEESPWAPNNPYSASKTGADAMVRAYHHTYGLPAIITRSSNNYGPYQYPEKLIPAVIAAALNDRPVSVYGDGSAVRDWLHVHDHCRGLALVAAQGHPGRVYNIGGGNERPVRQVIEAILHALDKPLSLMQYTADRPGHDLRYALDCSRIRRELGWQPAQPFAAGLTETVTWYVSNRPWWQPLLAGQRA